MFVTVEQTRPQQLFILKVKMPSCFWLTGTHHCWGTFLSSFPYLHKPLTTFQCPHQHTFHFNYSCVVIYMVPITEKTLAVFFPFDMSCRALFQCSFVCVSCYKPLHRKELTILFVSEFHQESNHSFKSFFLVTCLSVCLWNMFILNFFKNTSLWILPFSWTPARHIKVVRPMYGTEVFDGETARFEVELSEDDVHGQWRLNGEVLSPSPVRPP